MPASVLRNRGIRSQVSPTIDASKKGNAAANVDASKPSPLSPSRRFGNSGNHKMETPAPSQQKPKQTKLDFKVQRKTTLPAPPTPLSSKKLGNDNGSLDASAGKKVGVPASAPAKVQAGSRRRASSSLLLQQPKAEAMPRICEEESGSNDKRNNGAHGGNGVSIVDKVLFDKDADKENRNPHSLLTTPHHARTRKLLYTPSRTAPVFASNGNMISFGSQGKKTPNSILAKRKRSGTLADPFKANLNVLTDSNKDTSIDAKENSVLSDAKEAVVKEKSTGNIAFAHARSVFRRSSGETPTLIGREAERAQLERFWDSCSISGGGSIYISGNPGTGKTAFVTEVCAQKAAELGVKTICINAMSVDRVNDIYKRIHEELIDEISENIVQDDVPTSVAPLSEEEQLEQHFASGESKTLLILDEIDHLVTSDAEILYKLFDWPRLPKSKLVLVGIANSLDFTDRFLPRLSAKNLKPELLNFRPYSVDEILQIVKTKFALLNAKQADRAVAPLMAAGAIELCARKVAAASGDLRKAMDICRFAIDAAQSDYTAKESSGASVVPQVTIAHVLKGIAAMAGRAAQNKIEPLNLHQKTILVCALSLQKKSSMHESSAAAVWTVGNLHSAYTAFLLRTSLLPPVGPSEFLDLIGGLEQTGLLSTLPMRGSSSSNSISGSSMNASNNNNSSNHGNNLGKFINGSLEANKNGSKRDYRVVLEAEAKEIAAGVNDIGVLREHL